MVDVTKCAGVFCRVRETCYRYTAPPTDLNKQSWCAFYASGSFKRATGCDDKLPIPSDKQRIEDDFNKSVESISGRFRGRK